MNAQFYVSCTTNATAEWQIIDGMPGGEMVPGELNCEGV